MPFGFEYTRTPARIGPIYFKRFGQPDSDAEDGVGQGPGGRFSHPNITVDTEASTVEHETLNDRTVIQQFGSKPDKLTIDGVAPKADAERMDELTKTGTITIRTSRWSGTVIVTSTSTEARRERTVEGQWLYDFTIEASEVTETDQRLKQRTISADEAGTAIEQTVEDAQEFVNQEADDIQDAVTSAFDNIS